MQTLSRYISNTFSDTEKQHSINVFLGYFIPLETKGKEQMLCSNGNLPTLFVFFFAENIPIWELPTDYFMHNLQNREETDVEFARPLTQWVSPFTSKHLPFSTCDSNKIVDELIRVHSRDLEMIDFYSAYHVPYKWTSFEENIAFQISLLARCFAPKFRTHFGPFEPATRREARGILKNPSLTGQSSTGSTNSSDSSMDDTTSTDDDSILENSNPITSTVDDSEQHSHFGFRSKLLAMMDIYKTKIRQPSAADIAKYKQYARMGKVFMSNAPMLSYNPKKPLLNRHKRMVNLESLGNYGKGNYKQVEAPKVSSKSIKIYEKYVQLPEVVYDRSPSTSDLDTINKYISLLRH